MCVCVYVCVYVYSIVIYIISTLYTYILACPETGCKGDNEVRKM